MQEHSPAGLEYFAEQGITRIEQVNQNSGLYYEDPPTIRLTNSTTFFSLTWLAGVLVHEACHMRQYRQMLKERDNPYSLSRRNFNTAITEAECIAQQLEIARAVGAPQKEIRQITSEGGSHAYTPGHRQDW